jgi:Ala-tRNA(Pro) deacylase
MRIAEFLTTNRIAFQSLVHAPAYSARQLARYLEIPYSQVVKAVLLRRASAYQVAVLPATCQVDTRRLACYLEGPTRLAGLREIPRLFPDCEWGVVPAFGHLYGLSTLLDEAIDPDSEMVFEAQTTVEAIRLLCRDYERLERPRRLPFSRKVPNA